MALAEDGDARHRIDRADGDALVEVVDTLGQLVLDETASGVRRARDHHLVALAVPREAGAGQRPGEQVGIGVIRVVIGPDRETVAAPNIADDHLDLLVAQGRPIAGDKPELGVAGQQLGVQSASAEGWSVADVQLEAALSHQDPHFLLGERTHQRRTCRYRGECSRPGPGPRRHRLGQMRDPPDYRTDRTRRQCVPSVPLNGHA